MKNLRRKIRNCE